MFRKFILFILCSWGTFCFAQQTQLQNIVTSQEKQHMLAENIILQTDKNFHIAGEVLWFKVYVLNSGDHTLQDISRVAYAELVDAQNVSKQQFKIGLTNGMGSGSFHIPFTFPSGIYRFRVYTNWMKNDPSSFYEKELTIINTTQTLDTAAFRKKETVAAGFYPEGGKLVNGVENNVVFYFPEEGNFSGMLVDDVNDTLLHFKSEASGVGNFVFTPEEGKKYTAVIQSPQGQETKKVLPKSVSSGYALSMKDTDEQIQLKVLTRNETDPFLFTIVRKGGKLSYAAYENVSNQSSTFVIKKSDLPPGVSVITVYNSKQQPVAQRKYFKNFIPASLSLQTDKKIFDTRSPVRIDLQTNDTITQHLSASVYRLNDLTAINNTEFVTGPMQIKGEQNDPELLNKYWTVIDGPQDHKTSSFEYVPEMNGQLVTVLATDKSTGEPVADVPVYLSLLGKTVNMQHAYTGKDGKVYFNLKNIYGKHQLVLQTKPEFENKIFLNIEKPFSPAESKVATQPVSLSESLREPLEMLNNHVMVTERFSGPMIDSFVTRYSDSLSFYGKPYATYMLDDYKRFVTMEEVLREYVQEVNVRIKGKNYSLKTFNEQYFTLGKFINLENMMNGDPLIFLDGVPVFDADKIIKYDPLKVRKIEVVANRYNVGRQSWDGVVSFTTYKGDLEGFHLDPGVVVVDFDGLQEQRNFYSPDYSDLDLRNNRIPDFREVLYWNPAITTGRDGKAKISFYTGDLKGKFVAVVRGISSNGQPIYSKTEFEVK